LQKKGIDTGEFEKFLRVQRNLSDVTVEKHVAYAETFFKRGSSISDFLLNIKILGSLLKECFSYVAQ